MVKLPSLRDPRAFGQLLQSVSTCVRKSREGARGTAELNTLTVHECLREEPKVPRMTSLSLLLRLSKWTFIALVMRSAAERCMHESHLQRGGRRSPENWRFLAYGVGFSENIA